MITDSLSRRLHGAKRSWKLRQYGAAISGLADKVNAGADARLIEDLRARVAPVLRHDTVSAAKYATPADWLPMNALRIGEVGLHSSSGLRVLDIGCGPGFFVAMARALGHDAYGVDAPPPILNPVEEDVYTTLTTAFHIRDYVSPLLIERYRPLPFRDRPFDLITAFWICFNRHCQPDEWGAAEWRYFVEDAFACLRPGGRLVLDLNENAGRYGELRFYDGETLEYFASVGRVDKGRLVLPRP